MTRMLNRRLGVWRRVAVDPKRMEGPMCGESLQTKLSEGLFLRKKVESLIAAALTSTFFCGHGQTWHPRLSPAFPAFSRLCCPSLREPRAPDIFLLVKTSV